MIEYRVKENFGDQNGYAYIVQRSKDGWISNVCWCRNQAEAANVCSAMNYREQEINELLKQSKEMGIDDGSNNE